MVPLDLSWVSKLCPRHSFRKWFLSSAAHVFLFPMIHNYQVIVLVIKLALSWSEAFTHLLSVRKLHFLNSAWKSPILQFSPLCLVVFSTEKLYLVPMTIMFGVRCPSLCSHWFLPVSSQLCICSSHFSVCTFSSFCTDSKKVYSQWHLIWS